MDSAPPAARAIWSGVVSFGLVVMPVRLFSATEEHPIRLREIHKQDAGRIRHKRVCQLEDQDREVPYEDVGRGFELPDGRMVPLSDDDLERLPLPTRHVVQVLGFVPGADVDPISYGKAYYAAPAGPQADRPYALLAAALARTGSVAVARIVIRTRERLAVVRPRHGVLVVHTLLWPDEVRDPGEDFAPAAPVTDRELQLAELLISELAGVETHELQDRYGDALAQLVEAKIAGGEIAELPPPQPAGELVAALEESVRRAGGAAGGRR